MHRPIHRWNCLLCTWRTYKEVPRRKQQSTQFEIDLFKKKIKMQLKQIHLIYKITNVIVTILFFVLSRSVIIAFIVTYLNCCISHPISQKEKKWSVYLLMVWHITYLLLFYHISFDFLTTILDHDTSRQFSITVTQFGSFIIHSLRFFTSVLPDGFSLGFEWQQVSSSLQDSFQYSGRSQ